MRCAWWASGSAPEEPAARLRRRRPRRGGRGTGDGVPARTGGVRYLPQVPSPNSPSLAQIASCLKPDNVSFEQAAAVPISGFAALQAVRAWRRSRRPAGVDHRCRRGRGYVRSADREGERGRGDGCLQSSKTELVRSIGADHVIDYTREDFADGRHRYDVILDIAGNRSLSELRRALTPRGTLVIVGAEDAGNWLGIRRQLRAAALSPFLRQKLGFFISKERRQDLEELRTLLEAGTIRPSSTGRSRSKRCPTRSATSERAARAARSSSLSDPRLAHASRLFLGLGSFIARELRKRRGADGRTARPSIPRRLPQRNA